MTSTQVKVTFQNIAPENGAVISPQWFSFHDGSFDLFNPGETASSAIKLVAEDGLTGREALVPGFVEYLQAQNFDFSRTPPPALTVAGIFAASPAGQNGGVQDQVTQFRPTNPTTIGQAPGEDASVIVTLDNAEQQRYFSFLSMMFPTNDGFIANENPNQIEVFDEDGNFVGADLIIRGDQVWDSGTEINDESLESIPYTARTIGQGQSEGGVITPYPGFLPLGAGGVLDSTDVFGDQIRFFDQADFTQPGYEVARIIISEVESLEGTHGDDEIRGSDQDNSIRGLNGEDTIVGAGGDDQLLGGTRNDILIGGLDDDSLQGEKGHDRLLGQRGRDLLEGGSGDDTLIGGLDSDTLLGDAGKDLLRGGGQDDFLLGGRGNDTLSGGQGQDVLLGGSGADLLLGNIGDDFLDGGKHRDTIKGGSGNDIANGREGHDLLEGHGGEDQINGGDGNDTIDGGQGNDQLLGGAGRDFFVLRDGDGTDTILDYQLPDTFILSDGLAFEDLKISQGIGQTEISVLETDEVLAILSGVEASILTADQFISV